LGHSRAPDGKQTLIPMPPDHLAVVHNGIIENFRELREELEKEGAAFGSETDNRGCGASRHPGTEQRPLSG